MPRKSVGAFQAIAELRGLQQTAAAAAAGQAAEQSRTARACVERAERDLHDLRRGWEASLTGAAVDLLASRHWSAAWHRQARVTQDNQELLGDCEAGEATKRTAWHAALAIEDAASDALARARTRARAHREEARLSEAADHVARRQGEHCR